MIMRLLRPTLGLLVIATVSVGLLYPLLMTGIAQVVFPAQANGSLLRDATGAVRGSALIGQQFSDPRYFWGRLSATGPYPYNAAASSGTNYGPLNPDLFAAAEERIAALKADGAATDAPVPVDLVTASGSGLDPQISPAAATFQLARVAQARGLDVAVVRQLVADHTEGRTLGLFGEPRVNVLELNLALDDLQ